ncbi:integrase family protein (plasmid) [Thermovibrio ammonificans HB-1]|uniref:Integrase family protein n=1 Tax=Thermovibrio ammonificans (strain DSM 15698 / JCM 12110 / HB-1) TaxID=648996 RepID=E8T6Z8_THEA1|nr:site-specific integrase [Thermovibrio ammonificans]ADU97719.1 integrase family protein [Thermovibrio ammonificans HB-1]
MKLSELYTDWLLALHNSTSPHTYRMYKKRVGDLIKALEVLGAETVEDLQGQTGKELLYHALQKHSPSVVEQSLAAWSNFRDFVEAVKGITLPSIPRRNLPKPKEKKPKPISREELRKLLDYLKEKDKEAYLAALLMAYAGLRASEVLSLSKFSFQREGNRLIVRVKGKGGKERVVPLPAGVSREIEENLNLFPLFKWSSSPYYRLYRKLRQAGKRVGIADFHPHRLRHTFGTELARRGVRPEVIRTLMGHSNLNTTAGYIGIADEELFEAVERLEFKGL